MPKRQRECGNCGCHAHLPGPCDTCECSAVARDVTTPSDAAPPSDRAKVVAWQIVDKDGAYCDLLDERSEAESWLWSHDRNYPDRAPFCVVPLVAESTLVAALAEVERLMSGPYTVRACRGHWHVYNDGSEIITDAGTILDEATARSEAAKLNARHKQDVYVLQRELAAERSRRETAERLLTAVVESACEDGHTDHSTLLSVWVDNETWRETEAFVEAIPARAPSEQSDPRSPISPGPWWCEAGHYNGNERKVCRYCNARHPAHPEQSDPTPEPESQ